MSTPQLQETKILELRRIDRIRDFLDWEVWAPTRGNADAYTWYGIAESDIEGMACITELKASHHVVQGEYSVILPNGKPGMLFGVSNE
jgi:hypothetical protein